MSEHNWHTPESAAEQLILIARDLRAAGDVPLVELSEEGVTRSSLTLAGELELIALGLDYDGVIARVAEVSDG